MTGTILVPLLPAEIRALVLWHRLESHGRSELGTDVHLRRDRRSAGGAGQQARVTGRAFTAVEDRIILDGRAAGLSWSAIGARLGTTGKACQCRLARARAGRAGSKAGSG